MGTVYQVGRSRFRKTECESFACIESTDRGDGRIEVTDTDEGGTALSFITDEPSIQSFAERGPANRLAERGPTDNIEQIDMRDGYCILLDARAIGSILTTQENVANYRKDVLADGMGELMTAQAVQYA